MDVRLTQRHNGRCYISIMSQQQRIIGLFELIRIQQYIHGSINTVMWIRSVVSPFNDWVRHRASLENDPQFFETQIEHVELLCDDHLRLNTDGHIYQNSVIHALLTRMPYIVSFWEQNDFFPVYTISSDYRLPWARTVYSNYIIPSIEIPPTLPFQTESVNTSTLYSIPNDDICPITLEPLCIETTYWTPCGHAFSEAIFRALTLDERCPLCRSACVSDDILH